MYSDEKLIISCSALIFALIILIAVYVACKESERLDEMYAECITTERDKFECHSLIYD